jgi:ubiquinone/menaquinone biosynthesis C-methylase UbiE
MGFYMKKYLLKPVNPAGNIDLFDELPFWSAPFGLKLLDHIDYMPNITALDIGFGTGFPLIELAMRLGESSVVYGIDPWQEAYVTVNKKIEFYRITNIRLIKGMAESVPLADNSVDLIVSNNGINNVSDIEKVFSECSRIMRKGGQFIMTMNLDKSLVEFYDQLEIVLAKMHLDKEIEMMHRHIYEKRRPLEEITSMLSKHGFTIKDLQQDQFTYQFTDGTAMFNHYFIRNAFMEAWMKFLPEAKFEKILDKVETRLNEQARVSGGIKMSVPFALISAIFPL